MKKLLALVAMLVSAPCYADPIFSYNDLDIGYRHIFFDEKELDDANGLETRLRLSPIQNFFLEGGYRYLDTGLDSVDVDANTFTYGIGGYVNFCDEWHLVGRVGGIHEDLETDAGDFDDDGYYLGLEARFDYEHKAEIDLAATYLNVDHDGEWLYDATVLVPVCKSAAVLLNASINDDTDVGLLAGVRVVLD